jgi:hypothetical protein
MITARVRKAAQRADKHRQVPRQLPDLVLTRDGILARGVVSHD